MSASSAKLVDFAAGAASGLVADGITHPIDTIRTRLWVQDAGSGYKYRGLVNGLVTMVRKEGVASLFKGMGSVALLTPVAHGLYFGSYEWAKTRLACDEAGMGNTAAIMTAGFFANVVGALVWNPMDVVKQKQQAMVGKELGGALGGLSAVYAEGGLRNGLMRGYFSGIATYGPFSAIYFLTYERFKDLCLQRSCGRELGTEHFVAGGLVAGTVAAVATSPIDLIKTRIQVCDGYHGVLLTGLRIFREEGLAAFTKGVGARVVWVRLCCACLLPASSAMPTLHPCTSLTWPRVLSRVLY
jgi:solute carrier family 25 iron transporter 28/37